MKIKMKLFALSLFIPMVIWSADSSKLLGTWKTIDDKTGKESSIVEIKTEGENLIGFVNHLFSEPDTSKGKICDKCKGELHNKRVRGMQIIRNMHSTNGEWFEGGFILDPKNGTEYHCKMRLIHETKELEVRGFIGFSLIGRSQIWKRN